MMPEASRLYLVDGSAYIFRAFFAIPALTNSAGMPTNAIYGFTNMMLKFVKQHRPRYLSVALDAGRDTFRNRIYEAYKGNRPEAPPQLIPQFPYIRKALEALRVNILEREGFEADDLIATLCRSLSGAADEIVVVSSDKDLMQLVTDGIKLLDGAKEKWIGRDEVKEKFGVDPSRVIEVMGLMGDAVDNIPGVKGIGEKTAAALIQRFQSLENLFDHLEEVEQSGMRGAARIRQSLERDRETAFLSRELATVKSDVPLSVPLESLRYDGPDKDKLRALFTELEFNNLLKLLDTENSA